MELELIEPFLFFDYKPGAMQQFVEITAHIAKNSIRLFK